MTVFEIEQVIPFARSACDWACEDLQSNRPQYCDAVSSALAIGLHWLGIEDLELVTSYIPTPDPVDPEAGHVWLRWRGHIALDATASQFSDYFAEREVVVGISEWHNRLIEKKPPIRIDAERVLKLQEYHWLARRCFRELLQGYGIDLEIAWTPDGKRIWNPKHNRQ